MKAEGNMVLPGPGEEEMGIVHGYRLSLSCEGTYFLPFGLRSEQLCRMARLVHNDMNMSTTMSYAHIEEVRLRAGRMTLWVKCVLQEHEDKSSICRMLLKK